MCCARHEIFSCPFVSLVVKKPLHPVTDALRKKRVVILRCRASTVGFSYWRGGKKGTGTNLSIILIFASAFFNKIGCFCFFDDVCKSINQTTINMQRLITHIFYSGAYDKICQGGYSSEKKSDITRVLFSTRNGQQSKDEN
jgi:triphosphoribosyl-dephospho-CoA synthetase